MLERKLSMTLELDEVPRYFIKIEPLDHAADGRV